jgi:paraquat-inducible protein B
VKLNTESLTSVLIGGLAFQAPDGAAPEPLAAENAVFTLFTDRAQAMKQPISVTERYALEFRESVRGLAPGAPVDFRGLLVGEVKSVEPRFDRERRQFAVIVEIDFYPERLFRNRAKEGALPTTEPSLARLVERGLRGQLRSANLLTGQLFVALDIVPGTSKAAMDVSQSPPQIPTVPGSTPELQSQIASIAKKLDSVPYQEIGMDLRRTLQISSAMLERVDRETAPEMRDTMVEARKAMTEAREALVEARKALASVERTLVGAEPLPLEAGDALREIARAAQSFRTLADYLERHPEAVIRGKREDAK